MSNVGTSTSALRTTEDATLTRSASIRRGLSRWELLSLAKRNYWNQKLWNWYTRDSQCDCDAGFRGDGYTCKDIDECANDNTLCENGHCLNYPGSFRCECEMGFMHPDESNEQTCVDINECEMFSNLCVFGRCENIFGMFRCECHEGYKLDGSGGNCTDIDECENPQSCQYGTCVNTQGKYICKCPPYYELVEAGNACVGALHPLLWKLIPLRIVVSTFLQFLKISKFSSFSISSRIVLFKNSTSFRGVRFLKILNFSRKFSRGNSEISIWNLIGVIFKWTGWSIRLFPLQTDENRFASSVSNTGPEGLSASLIWHLRWRKRRAAAALATLGEIVARSVPKLERKNSRNCARVVPDTGRIRRPLSWRISTNARSTRISVRTGTAPTRSAVSCAPATRALFWMTLKAVA